MKCFIDNRETETDPSQSIAITLSIASISQIETGRTGYSKTLKLPITTRNRAIMGDAGEILSPQRFNQTPHTARIEKEGCIVMEGTPMLTKREENPDGSGWYHLNIIGAGKNWVQAASERMFNELEINCETTLNASNVLQSWNWINPCDSSPYNATDLPSPLIPSNPVSGSLPSRIITPSCTSIPS